MDYAHSAWPKPASMGQRSAGGSGGWVSRVGVLGRTHQILHQIERRQLLPPHSRHTALQHRLLTAAWLRTPPSQLCRVRHQTSPPSPLARAAAQLTTRSDPPAKLSEQGSCLCGRGACAGFARYNPRPFSRQIQRPSGEEWRGVERTGEGGGGSGLGPAGLHQLLRIIIRPSLRHHVLHQHRPHAVRRRRRACAVSESSVILLTSPLHPY